MLEVGAGAGHLARALRATGYEMVAIDPKSESDYVGRMHGMQDRGPGSPETYLTAL